MFSRKKLDIFFTSISANIVSRVQHNINDNTEYYCFDFTQSPYIERQQFGNKRPGFRSLKVTRHLNLRGNQIFKYLWYES